MNLPPLATAPTTSTSSTSSELCLLQLEQQQIQHTQVELLDLSPPATAPTTSTSSTSSELCLLQQEQQQIQRKHHHHHQQSCNNNLKYWGLPTSVTKTCAHSTLGEIMHMYALRIPHSTGGIMLNIMGLTSWCNIFHHTGMQSETNAKVISFVQSSLYGVVLLLLCLFLFKTIMAPKAVAQELLNPDTCGAYGAATMAVTLLFAQVRWWHQPMLTYMSVALTSLLQFTMLCWYIGRLIYLKAPPSPSCFPATVGIGMSAIAGHITGVVPRTYQYLHPAFVVAVACAFVLFPWVAVRLLRDPTATASPAVFVLAAPWSLCTIAFFNTMALPGASMGVFVVACAHVLFVFSTVGMLTTLGCAFARSTVILQDFWRAKAHCCVHPADSDVTFPIVAYSIVCMYYSIHICNGFLLWWAWLWVVVCVVVVGGINVSFLWCLPGWIRRTFGFDGTSSMFWLCM